MVTGVVDVEIRECFRLFLCLVLLVCQSFKLNQYIYKDVKVNIYILGVNNLENIIMICDKIFKCEVIIKSFFLKQQDYIYIYIYTYICLC